MAYEKKNLYPSALKPGVYPDGTTKELGLNSDELENISLGNWNSIVKNDRVFLSEYFKQYVVPEVVEPEIQNIPISLLPLITTNGVFNGSMPRNELNHRFFIEIFGYYLNTKTLLDAGFGNGDGGGTDFPVITYGGVTLLDSGTAPGINIQEHPNQYIYYSYDPTKYFIQPDTATAFPQFPFSAETNPIVVILTVAFVESLVSSKDIEAESPKGECARLSVGAVGVFALFTACLITRAMFLTVYKPPASEPVKGIITSCPGTDPLKVSPLDC